MTNWLLLAAVASLGTLCTGAAQKHWGDPHYNVELHMIEASGGSLLPPFSPGHADYEVEMKDQLRQDCELHLALDASKYFVDEPPKIKVDGKEMNYSLAGGIRVRVLLNETWANVDKVVRIEVIDPKTEGGVALFGQSLSSPRSFKYRIRIYQGPDYRHIVKPLALDVTNDFGEILVSDSAFDPNLHRYLYIIGEGVATAHINMTCPTIPGHTHKLHEDARVGNDEQYTLDLSTSFVADARVACTYQDDRFVTQEPVRNEYTFSFKRHVEEKAVVKAQLLMIGKIGYCKQVNPNIEQLKAWKGDTSLVDRGFICRIDGPFAQVVPALTGSSVEAKLTCQSSGESYVLPADRISSIPVKGRRIFTMTVEAGDAKAWYPVLIVRVAPCTDLSVPFGKVRRTVDANHAQTHMCSAETCSLKRDRDVCFVNPANCSSYAGGCPAGKVLRVDAADVDCLKALCTIQNDQKRCCSSKAVTTPTVEDWTSGTGDVPRMDLVGNDILESRPDEVVYDVRFEDGSKKRNIKPGGIVALHRDAGKFRVHDQVMAEHRRAFVTKLGHRKIHVRFRRPFHYHHGHKHKVSGWFKPSQLVLVTAGFFPGDYVFLNGREGRIKYRCGQAKKCRVIFKDHSHTGPVPAQDIIRKHGFCAGEEVVVHGRKGLVKDHCVGRAQQCHVSFADDHRPESGTYPASQVRREVGFVEGEAVVAEGRQARISQTCACNAKVSTCKAKFDDDGSSTGELVCSNFVKRGGFHIGLTVLVGSKQGTIIGRRPRAKYDVGFLSDERGQYAQGENSNVHALQISAEQVGNLVKPLEEEGTGQRDEGGSLEVGTQVLASGHAAIINEVTFEDASQTIFRRGPLSLGFALLTAAVLMAFAGWISCRSRFLARAELPMWSTSLVGRDHVQLLPGVGAEGTDVEVEPSRPRSLMPVACRARGVPRAQVCVELAV